MAIAIERVRPFHSMNADSKPDGRRSSDKDNGLGLWVHMLLSTIAIYYYCYYSTKKLIAVSTFIPHRTVEHWVNLHRG